MIPRVVPPSVPPAFVREPNPNQKGLHSLVLSILAAVPHHRLPVVAFDDHMSEHLSSSGGVGLADTLLRDWERIGQIPDKDGKTVDRAAPQDLKSSRGLDVHA